MWFLWVFGDNVEDRLGHLGYLLFYLGSGVLASFSHYRMYPESVLPTIGVTAIGYFVVHRKDSLEVRDVPYMYTLSLLLVLALGAGRYSLDYYLLNLI